MVVTEERGEASIERGWLISGAKSFASTCTDLLCSKKKNALLSCLHQTWSCKFVRDPELTNSHGQLKPPEISLNLWTLAEQNTLDMLQKARTLNTHVIFRKGTGNWELAVGTLQRNRVLICKDECRYEAAPNAFRMPPATHRESSRSKEGMRRLPLPPLIFF